MTSIGSKGGPPRPAATSSSGDAPMGAPPISRRASSTRGLGCTNMAAAPTWNHPNMPWDGTELWEAELTADGVRALRKVAGGEGESIFQPSWSPDGVLYFVSDRSNWWNLYRWRGPTVETVVSMPAELGT